MINKKLTAHPQSEMGKLKEAWLQLSDEDRAGWQELFSSSLKIPEIRSQLAERLGIRLNHDQQWCRFRDWELQLRRRTEESERVEEDYRQLLAEFGTKWTLEEIHAEVLKRIFARAIATGDFKQALAAGREVLRLKQVGLQERRVVVIEQRAAASASADAGAENEDEENFRPRLTPEENRRRLREILK